MRIAGQQRLPNLRTVAQYCATPRFCRDRADVIISCVWHARRCRHPFDRQLREIASLAPAEARERGVCSGPSSPGPAAGASAGPRCAPGNRIRRGMPLPRRSAISSKRRSKSDLAPATRRSPRWAHSRPTTVRRAATVRSDKRSRLDEAQALAGQGLDEALGLAIVADGAPRLADAACWRHFDRSRDRRLGRALAKTQHERGSDVLGLPPAFAGVDRGNHTGAVCSVKRHSRRRLRPANPQGGDRQQRGILDLVRDLDPVPDREPFNCRLRARQSLRLGVGGLLLDQRPVLRCHIGDRVLEPAETRQAVDGPASPLCGGVRRRARLTGPFCLGAGCLREGGTEVPRPALRCVR